MFYQQTPANTNNDDQQLLILYNPQQLLILIQCCGSASKQAGSWMKTCAINVDFNARSLMNIVLNEHKQNFDCVYFFIFIIKM
jgi:invasion protein IalB